MSEWKEKMKKAATFEFPYQYEIIFGLLCVFSTVMFRPNELPLEPYNLYLYFMNYMEDGFLAKGFIGTIVTSIFEKMDERTFYIMYGCILGFVFLFFLFFIGEVVRIRKKENELFMVYLGSVLCFAPCSVTVFTGREMFGSQELFLVFFFLASMVLLYKRKGYGALLPFSIIAVLVDERYILTYLPAVLVFLFYQNKKEKKNSKWTLFYTIGGCCGVLAVILRFFLKSSEKDASTFYQTLMGRTSINLTWDNSSLKKALYTIYCDYFTGMKDWFSFRTMTGTDYRIFVISLILCIPVILFLGWIWFLFIKNSRMKGIAILFPAVILLSAPLFLFGSDYGWNLIRILFVQLITVFSLIGIEDSAMISAICDIKAKFQKHQWLFWILPVYLLLLGDIDGQGMTFAYLIQALF